MKISIIVPTLNIGAYLPKLLKSIRRQRGLLFEVVFIDGGSKDNTDEIIRRFIKSESSYKIKHFRIQYYPQKSNGLSNAFNEGIERSKGDYLIFMGGDDYFTSKYSLKKAEVILDKYEPDILCGEAVKDYSGLFTKPKYTRLSKYGFFYRLSFMMPVSHQNMFIRRSLFENVGLYDRNVKSGMDLDLLHKSLRSGCSLHITNVNFSTFVHRRDAISKKMFINHFLADIPRFVSKYGVVPIVSAPILLLKYHRNVTVRWFDASKFKDSQEPLDIYNLPF